MRQIEQKKISAGEDALCSDGNRKSEEWTGKKSCYPLLSDWYLAWTAHIERDVL